MTVPVFGDEAWTAEFWTFIVIGSFGFVACMVVIKWAGLAALPTFASGVSFTIIMEAVRYRLHRQANRKLGKPSEEILLPFDLHQRYEAMREELHPNVGESIDDETAIEWVVENFREWAERNPPVGSSRGGGR